ncbi:hypothetical protein GOBAR_AA38089 [Gossypium barbadense]|uniref:Retrotransposon Copia-like N-terminal domain-containing protein n=1 Tax=Gossypium barbadense TaxID=3634 RepID=A0A2P5VUW7_GOSBA|nr:hypothetical protein GOBAR_AA38089 [Gossypium barbadense]
MEFSQHSVQSTAPAMVSAVDNFDTRFFSTKKISVILDDDNFLLWRQQVLLETKTYKLQRFLDSSTIPPPATLPDTDGIPQENSEFSRFEQQDSALASWLLSSVSTTALPHLIASCSEVISERKHVMAILNGLPPEYVSVITIITASHTPYTVQGIMTMLIDAEARHQTMILESPSLANVVTHQPPGSATNSDPPLGSFLTLGGIVSFILSSAWMVHPTYFTNVMECQYSTIWFHFKNVNFFSTSLYCQSSD